MTHKHARRRRPARGSGHTKLKIIGGQWRSRLLPVADTPGLRPTPNRVRETLFNWLAPILPGARCIDLFAGTGALGIEALSRGAEHALFVESDRRVAAAIEAALETLDASELGRVIVADGTRPAEWLSNRPVDLVFIDPPFAARLHGAALSGARSLITDTGRIYLEYPARNEHEINDLLEDDYEVLRQSHAAAVGFCLVGPKHRP